MIATRRERNLNDIAWPVLDEEYGPLHFTPCQPVEGEHVISSPTWPSETKPLTLAPLPNPADEDIRLGRTKTFSSMEELIDDLDQPE
jgi:hypothetical protein